MNYRMIVYIIGWVLNLEAVFMVPACITAVIYGERELFSLLLSMGLCLLFGIPLTIRKPRNRSYYAKEGCVTAALSWIIMSFMGSLPFIFSGVLPNPVDAMFETVSGFTTTGSSVITDIEIVPRCIVFWRSFTHWIGGMGVLVFLIALLPSAGNIQMNLMRAESPGPSVSRLVPKARSTAKILYIIYLVMTLVQILLLLLGDMPLFDALTITFGSAGTGGFGIKNDSMASYSVYCQVITTIFMILFGVNFSFYFLLFIRRSLSAFKMEEVRWYFGIIAAAILLIAWDLRDIYRVGPAIQQAAFQVGSIITTTGYATTDFNQWPSFSKTILVMLMFVGACAGSTGGGMKLSRFVILLKSIKKEFHQYLHPQSVKMIKMDGKPVEHEVLRSTNVFVITYIILFSFSVLAISLNEFDLVTNFTAVAATFNNIGPALGLAGPASNFAFFSNPSKLVLTFDMLAGRLELFPLLLLFVRDTWKKF
ncbi:MAG TPA: TrkH family potassium uptake protein [Candidatus Enterocloster faecavium]|uniref:TrkH family potassium uptake protein n=1 Tax=Candidatus Enterocloster faecavium TaxID=2838560 RepID=A0A9D2L6D9_9FIRM|nr:TrkH family potassium uptake protein [Candidatus Enterocloster faecavium]